MEKSKRIRGIETIPGIGQCEYYQQDLAIVITLLEIIPGYRRQGWGRLLFYRILCLAIELKLSRIVAVVADSIKFEASGFLSSLSFRLIDTDRSTSYWQYEIQLPLLFYCGSGGASEYDAIAVNVGWLLGVRSCGKWKPRQHIQMLDNQWLGYNHEKHLAAVKQHKPLVATARDIEYPEQLPEILEQATEISQYAGRVILIPKCSVVLDTKYWLGLPCGKYAKTSNPAWYTEHFTHLLGGSPNVQMRLASYLNVVSLDSNYAANVARFGTATWQGKQVYKAGNCYKAFEISLRNQKSYWHREWEISSEPMFQCVRF